MNLESETKPQESQHKESGSFYEPRTIPKKWDVSAFVSHGKPAREGTEEVPSEPAELTPPDFAEDESSKTSPAPFPQPRTIPGNWDVSGMK